jgi:hypothetical protein
MPGDIYQTPEELLIAINMDIFSISSVSSDETVVLNFVWYLLLIFNNIISAQNTFFSDQRLS